MKKPIQDSKQPKKDVYTVEEFCRLVRIGRTLYYKLIKQKLGPRIMKLGERSVRISHEAAVNWMKKMERHRYEQ